MNKILISLLVLCTFTSCSDDKGTWTEYEIEHVVFEGEVNLVKGESMEIEPPVELMNVGPGRPYYDQNGLWHKFKAYLYGPDHYVGGVNYLLELSINKANIYTVRAYRNYNDYIKVVVVETVSGYI